MRLLKVVKHMCVARLAQPESGDLWASTVPASAPTGHRHRFPFAQHGDGGQSRLAGVRSDLTHRSPVLR
ncbi:MAG: hypothetical protein QOI01_1689 [Mycobacterium sp.]|jgi:hypothetical protein|nr:hypothetical protein [Mycobacterium sp.]